MYRYVDANLMGYSDSTEEFVPAALLVVKIAVTK